MSPRGGLAVIAIGKRMAVVCMGVAGLLAAGAANATRVTMTFDELASVTFGQADRVANYYNGGCSTSFVGVAATCGGPDYGVVWTGAQIMSKQTATNPPSGTNTATTATLGGKAIMDVAAGFTGGLSFYYSASQGSSAFVFVFGGPGGSGSLLYSQALPINSGATGGFRCGTALGCWSLVDISFAGTAQSVVFAGTTSRLAFDNVSFDLPTPATDVPEPSVLGTFGLGSLLLGLFAGLRRRLG